MRRFLFIALAALLNIGAGVQALSPTEDENTAQDREEMIGQQAPHFSLYDLDGNLHSLDSLSDKPLVIEFGSWTCPIFRAKIEAMQTLQEKYDDRVNFVLIYTDEAHPSDGRTCRGVTHYCYLESNTNAGIVIPQHLSYEERVEVARDAQKALNLNMMVLVDDFDNSTRAAYYAVANGHVIITPEGTVISLEKWTDAPQIEFLLDQYLLNH